MARSTARAPSLIEQAGETTRRRVAEFNETFDGPLNTYRDDRELFDKEPPDVVTFDKPDHWHVPNAPR